MKTYEISLRHDSGSVTIRTRASNIETAKQMVCDPTCGAKAGHRCIPQTKLLFPTQKSFRSIIHPKRHEAYQP